MKVSTALTSGTAQWKWYGPVLAFLSLPAPAVTSALNRQLALEIRKNGGRVIWRPTQNPDPDLETFLLPEVPEAFLGLVEILPLQLLTLIKAAEKKR